MTIHPNRDSSKNDTDIHKKSKLEVKLEPSSTVTFLDSGGLEKSKSDSKLNQVSFS